MRLSDSEDDAGSSPAKGVSKNGMVRSERLAMPINFFLDSVFIIVYTFSSQKGNLCYEERR